MALDSITLGQRLREARENCRLTQAQAARAIGVARTALVHIEAGKRSLSTLELSQLAKIYQRSVADFFAEGEGQAQANGEEDPLVIIERLPPGLRDDSEVSRQVSRCLRLCAIGFDLQKTLGNERAVSLPAYELRAPTRPFEAVRQGERIADEERRRLGLGYGPIADMAELISGQGIWASGVCGLPRDMSGIFLRHSSVGMVVLVNHDHAKCRTRFSYVHEYGHCLLDRKRASVLVSRRENAQELIERRANAFAAAFLMPADGVRWFLDEVLEKGGPSRRYRVTYSAAGAAPAESEERPAPGSQQITYQDAATVAHHFGVSYAAAVYRLSDLSVIHAKETAHLLERSRVAAQLLGTVEESDGSDEGPPAKPTRKRHLRVKDAVCKTEHEEPPPKPSCKPDRALVSQVIRLATEAYRREEVSQGWLRDLSAHLEMPAEDLIELAEAAASRGRSQRVRTADRSG